ncbi:ABC-type thiamine transport system ATPase subunit [Novosphingobium chloroacetimidivorans]|uniref:ABC-type thiamine transport system ATPase subunit n=1 Tax=Novosphingobium chloroacetimidivorans TaxID=1428314 RepID=A0A7W7KF41_9SPHN|nr:ATP-binding protein [Novosphingobium chloroacetimidivorans]MBB4861099.1 ABC-type thiamine transport system ATPase subunit [Novosphingobium chloroacetimidivorans]
MAKLNIWNWISALGRWLEGGRAPRRLDATLLLDHTSLFEEAPTSPIELSQKNQIRESSERDSRRDQVKVARIFDSAHPVRTRGELFGRADELDTLLSATLDLGQHVIIHGARGSGKTSLVRVYGDHADGHGAVVIYMACEPGASFAELVRPYLSALPAAALAPEERVRFRNALNALPEAFGPRAFVDLVAERVASTVVFIFDEFDRITDPNVKAEMAAAMKLLADSLASVLFMLVGIAHNVADVIECHPSLRRHMRAVSLGRIEPSSVKALIDAGEGATGLKFNDDARAIIARASCGSPFHVRMFCHHAAIAALARGSSSVSRSDAHKGLHSAILQWAAMNSEDAQHFVSLVEDETLLPEIERIARTAALGDRLPSHIGDARALLGSALVPESNSNAAFVFRDSVAPQFLIAYAILAEVAIASDAANRLGGPIDAATL